MLSSFLGHLASQPGRSHNKHVDQPKRGHTVRLWSLQALHPVPTLSDAYLKQVYILDRTPAREKNYLVVVHGA